MTWNICFFVTHLVVFIIIKKQHKREEDSVACEYMSFGVCDAMLKGNFQFQFQFYPTDHEQLCPPSVAFSDSTIITTTSPKANIDARTNYKHDKLVLPSPIVNAGDIFLPSGLEDISNPNMHQVCHRLSTYVSEQEGFFQGKNTTAWYSQEEECAKSKRIRRDYCQKKQADEVRERIYRISAMQPVSIVNTDVVPKRRNVRISTDPQSVAARQRRERISQRMRILQSMVPGSTKLDTASMLDEAIHYVKFLKNQIQALELISSPTPPGSLLHHATSNLSQN